MLSLPPPHAQLVSTAVARTASLPLSARAPEGSSTSPEHCAPVIAVTRPSRVSASLDDSALDLLRAKYNAQNRDRSSSLSSYQFVRAANIANNTSKSAQSSPKLQRKASFKVKKLKLFRTPSNGMDGYEALNGDLANEANQFFQEKVTSVNRVLSRNSSFTSTPPSPRPFRAMCLVPAKHRVVQFDSSDEEESERSSLSDALSPEGESDLDFRPGSRSKVSIP